MPLSSGNSDTYIWKHLLSFKEKKYNPEACAFLFLPKLLLWSNPGVWAHPSLQGYGKTGDHSSPSPKDCSPLFHFISNSTLWVWISWGENAASPSCCSVFTSHSEFVKAEGGTIPTMEQQMSSPRNYCEIQHEWQQRMAAQKCICCPPPSTGVGML